MRAGRYSWYTRWMEDALTINEKDSGYRGIWYFNQPSNDEYVYKYSGGLGTYCAKHRPIAVYSPAVNKTFFCYGGCPPNAHRNISDSEITDGHEYERERRGMLLHMVSYFDHTTRTVPRPTILLDKCTADAHDNPVISIDESGYIWIFSTSHGTARPSYVHRSVLPFDIDRFELVPVEWETESGREPMSNFSYMQPWYASGSGFIAFLTRYSCPVVRTIGCITSRDGRLWSSWNPLAMMGQGHYQVSEVYVAGGQVVAGTVLNSHPNGANDRINLYYMETRDFGRSWTTADGIGLDLPLTDFNSVARIHNSAKDGKLIYLKDLSYDASGKPVILYLESAGFESGPQSGPRRWMTARWNGSAWDKGVVCESDSNYDTGCLLLLTDNEWMVVGPTETGPQEFNPGGEMAQWSSLDCGSTWRLERRLTQNSRYNHTYARRPLNANPDFIALWADGNPRRPSESRLYFADIEGRVFRLPENIRGDAVAPKMVESDAGNGDDA